MLVSGAEHASFNVPVGIACCGSRESTSVSGIGRPEYLRMLVVIRKGLLAEVTVSSDYISDEAELGCTRYNYIVRPNILLTTQLPLTLIEKSLANFNQPCRC